MEANKEKSYFISLKFTRGRILAAALLAAVSITVLILFPYLIIHEDPDGSFPVNGRNLLLFGGIVLSSCIVVLLDIRLPNRARRIFGWVSMLVYPLIVLIFVEWINDTYLIYSLNIGKWFANYLCNVMIFALFYAIFRNACAAAIGGFVLSLLFGIATYYTTLFRGVPILPWDLQSFGTAMDVMGGYEFTVTNRIAFSVFVCMFLCVCSFLCLPKEKTGKLKTRLIERAASFLVFAGLLIAIVPLDILTPLGIAVWPWNQKVSTRMTGVMGGFFGNLQFIMVDKPQGYSADTLADLKAEIKTYEEPKALGSPDKDPTIIVVMNESLTDFTATGRGNITLVPDNMPFIHSLMQSGQYITGTAYSSVFGGNTCDSEYEFLTGNSVSFLPIGSKPYQQFIKSDQTSLVSTLESYGYDSIAIHPGTETAWNRDTAYPYLGFDKFIYANLFHYNRIFERKMTSDRSCYDQVIYEYETHDSEDPLFIFNVTIQNHGGFEDPDYPTTIQVSGQEGVYPQAEQYMSVVKKSDESFQYLIEYFAAQDDPVVILLFGDHWPNLEEDFINALLGVDNMGDLTIEDTMKQYEVPFLIWANYPLEAQHIDTISLNYLSGLLLRSADLKGTLYNRYVETVRQTFPVISGVGMIDREGNIYERGDTTPYDEILNNYSALQYNQTFDEKNKDYELFTVTPEN